MLLNIIIIILIIIKQTQLYCNRFTQNFSFRLMFFYNVTKL